ncbi:succinate dehydrogenase, hydrophobic membrane anchor protein [Leeia oryzae]|uniref:succinate dehydrogenase, hydrophobic membrane anchor protein n=1 Tax=Leeia oryzae TaxID=356662 RepID=UPI000360968C|nr:succinate dehydrogenase, hydrophobic membrane anchor protein [Leeia oryzae]
MSKNRIVVGAHYGLRDWIMQRVTALVMLAYTVALVVILLAIPHDHEGWRHLFANHAVKVFTLVTFIALLLHAWVGVRDLWMDYIKPVGLRLTLHVLTIIWLVAAFIYAVNIIWSV